MSTKNSQQWRDTGADDGSSAVPVLRGLDVDTVQKPPAQKGSFTGDEQERKMCVGDANNTLNC